MRERGREGRERGSEGGEREREGENKGVRVSWGVITVKVQATESNSLLWRNSNG